MKYVVVASKDGFKSPVSEVGYFRAKSDDEAKKIFIVDYSSDSRNWGRYLTLYRIPLLFPFKKRVFITDND